MSAVWTGYGLLVYSRGRAPRFAGMCESKPEAFECARELLSAHSVNVLRVEIHRWQEGRIVEEVAVIEPSALDTAEH